MSYILGTALKLTIALDIDTATTAQIQIEDPSRVNKLDYTDMTKEADGIYSYVWQSDEDDNNGTWVATFKIVYGGYTSIYEKRIEMVDSYDPTD